MKDVLTYCPDTTALIAELQEKFPDRINIDEETGEASFILTKTPTVRNGDETLALVRVSDGDLLDMQGLTNLTVLGTYDEVFGDAEKKAIYDRVYPRTPIELEGSEQLPPERIGEFL